MNPLPYLPALVAAPARFSNPMRLREARKHLESAFAATNGWPATFPINSPKAGSPRPLRGS